MEKLEVFIDINKQYDEEMVADIVSNSHYIIHKIAEDYFKGDILKEVSE